MSLLKPTNGQMLDRLSILTLKLTACFEKRIDPVAFMQEREELRGRLGLPEGCLMPQGFAELVAVNKLIWEANDFLAELSARFDPPSNQAALQMWRWNMKRIAIIEEIDKACGQYVGPEKL